MSIIGVVGPVAKVFIGNSHDPNPIAVFISPSWTSTQPISESQSIFVTGLTTLMSQVVPAVRHTDVPKMVH